MGWGYRTQTVEHMGVQEITKRTTKPRSAPIVREIPGFPGYFAGEDGNIYSEKQRDRKALASQLGGPARMQYQQVGIYGPDGKHQMVKVHKLVLLAWVGPRPAAHEARHIDGDRFNNRPCNLVWGTKLENTRDKYLHGHIPFGDRSGAYTKPEAVPRGENHYLSKLTDRQTALIKRFMTRKGLKRGDGRKLALRFGVSEYLISLIKLGKCRKPAGSYIK